MIPKQRRRRCSRRSTRRSTMKTVVAVAVSTTAALSSAEAFAPLFSIAPLPQSPNTPFVSNNHNNQFQTNDEHRFVPYYPNVNQNGNQNSSDDETEYQEPLSHFFTPVSRASSTSSMQQQHQQQEEQIISKQQEEEQTIPQYSRIAEQQLQQYQPHQQEQYQDEEYRIEEHPPAAFQESSSTSTMSYYPTTGDSRSSPEEEGLLYDEAVFDDDCTMDPDHAYLFGGDGSIRDTNTQLDASFFNLNGQDGDNHNHQTPFVIEHIARKPSESLYRQIADLCIDVFFRESVDGAGPNDRVAPWKEAQIAYLKTLQTGDLRRRRTSYPETNCMFLCFEAVAVNGSNNNKNAWMRKPLLMNEDIQNLPQQQQSHHNSRSHYDDNNEQDFVRGRLLGFVEITKRPYGLGQGAQEEAIRPVLTNLAVCRSARTLGIGSDLLDACEQQVIRDWKMNEMVLEVEDDNQNAVRFYEKRGYSILYSDPAARRFDVGGLYLRKIRCTRRIMRKTFTAARARMGTSSPTTENFWSSLRQQLY